MTIYEQRKQIEDEEKAIQSDFEEAERLYDASMHDIFERKMALWRSCSHDAYTDEMFLARDFHSYCPDCGCLNPYTRMPHRFHLVPEFVMEVVR